jgi:hypothetical protein
VRLATGHVLIRENESTIEGDIELIGGQYRVRRPVGELIIQPEHVLKLCESREEAYDFLRHRANLRDPDERLRLANWCHLNGLKQQELEEVAAAVALRPDNQELVRLQRNLQRMLVLAAEAKHEVKPAPATAPAPIPASVNSESLSLFVTKVQPILMNRCASCHGSGRGGKFELNRVFEGLGASHRVTQLNIGAAVGQVRADHPSASPLLVKSVSVHGDMAQPALKGVDSAAYKTLEEWVRITLQAGPVTAQESGIMLMSGKADDGSAKPVLEKSASATATTGSFGAARDADKPANPAPVKAPDPYDPELFNKQAHPQGKPPGGS